MLASILRHRLQQPMTMYYYNYNDWCNAARQYGYTVEADGTGKHVAVDANTVERGIYGLYGGTLCGYFYTP